MKTAFTITALDLRRRLLDRSLLIQGVIAPVALALVVSVAFAGGSAIDFTIGVVDNDTSQTSQQLADQLAAASGNGINVVTVTNSATAENDIDAETLDAAIVVPRGLEQALASGDAPAFNVLVDSARPIGGDIAVAMAEGVGGRLDAVRLAVAAVPADPVGASAAANRAESPFALSETPVSTDYDVGSYFAPSMAILFLFLTIGSGARSLLTERKEGTLTRLRSTPATPGQIVAGKTISVFLLGLASFVAVYTVTRLFGTSWGSPAGVFALIATTTAAIAGLSTLVTGLARTDAQAEGYTSALTFGLALLGGNFVTPDAAPEILRTLGRLTPNGWALQSFTDLAAADASVADIAPALAVLTVIAIVAGTAGLALTTKQVRS